MGIGRRTYLANIRIKFNYEFFLQSGMTIRHSFQTLVVATADCFESIVDQGQVQKIGLARGMEMSGK